MNKEVDYRKLFSGINMPVALEDGSCVVPINFDNGATTPPFKCVSDCLTKHILMYGSIGRGKGQKSEYCTDAYEECRKFILDFFNLPNREDYTTIYVKNTTEGINLLSKSLINSKSDIVLLTRMEHHANDIPWRHSCKTVYADVEENGRLDLNNIEKVLKSYNGKIKLVSVTGASNVTGYINDINKIAEISHKYGAEIIVDAAQLVAHRKINMAGKGKDDYIDFLTFSAHKMYSPFGSGAVIGNKKRLNSGKPLLYGGGAVEAVLDNNVYWLDSPEKNEAGTPNFLGVVALVSAMKSLTSIGFENIQQHEEELKNYMIKEMEKLDRIILYGDSNCKNRLGVVPFNIYGIEHDVVAKRLADYRAVAVRHGGFCAHPYVRRLLNVSDETVHNYVVNGMPMPGMVRASLGLYNTKDEADEFISSLKNIIIRHG